ncbi:MAG: hypothetical protein NZM25_06325 [Leptospiraceae bacterium]|nr:hypothetical protein [Leptospiraceae bacterium]MDW8306608.1 hypothetical protein [Leptospiraceae bacterium]
MKILPLFRYFLPETCRFCKTKAALSQSIFCRNCLEKITYFPQQPERFCQVCGEEKEDGSCKNCQLRQHFFSKSHFLFFYENTALALLQELKFRQSRRAWDFVCQEMKTRLNFPDNGAFLPMPSSRRLAESVAYFMSQQYHGLFVNHVFQFEKESSTKKLGLRERFWHLEKMSLTPRPLPVANFYFLVDDIYTTGATVNKAARMIHEQRAIPIEKIFVFTLFRRRAYRRSPLR